MVVGTVLELPGRAAVRPDRVLAGPQGHILGIAEGPSRKGPGALFDVVLGIVAYPHREQLQQLPAIVLVYGVLVVVVVVQPEEHGRVLGKLDKKVAKRAQAALSEHADLVDQRGELGAHDRAGGEEAVPEQGGLLLQVVASGDHPVEPVAGGGGRKAELGLAYMVPSEDVVRDVSGFTRVEKALHRRLVAVGDEGFELVPSGAETGPAQQVRHQRDVLAAHAFSS